MKKDVIDKITKYYGYGYIIPFVCTFGIVCNLINLSVLGSGRLKESPYTYLTALAWSDLLTLTFTLTTTFTRGVWLETNSYKEFYLKKLERLFFLPSANVFSALSIAITVVLTIERYLFIRFPIHASSYCTSSNAKRIILVLVAVVFVFRLPMYFFSDVTLHKLNTSTTMMNLSTTNESSTTLRVDMIRKYEKFHKPYFFLSFLIFEIVPFILLFTFNLNLVLLIRSSMKELESFDGKRCKSKSDSYETRRSLDPDQLTHMALEQHAEGNRLIKHSSSAHSMHRFSLFKANNNNHNNNNNNNHHNNTNHNNNNHNSKHGGSNTLVRDYKFAKRKRDQNKLTRTLTSVVFFVLLSEISSIITYDKITESLIARHFDNYMRTYYVLQVFVSNLIVNIVHSVNFFLYCAFNQKYLSIFRQRYSRFFNFCTKLNCKKNLNQSSVI